MPDTDLTVVPADPHWLEPLADYVTPQGLRPLPDDMTYEQWEQLGFYIGSVFTASKWALGDWLAFGENHFPEKYAQAAERTGRSEQGLMNIASTSRAWPQEHRIGDYGLHEELKKQAREDIEGAKKILKRAVAQKLTRDQLRAELRPAVETKAEQSSAEAKFTVTEFEAAFEEWKAKGLYNKYRTRAAAMMAAFIKYLRS